MCWTESILTTSLAYFIGKFKALHRSLSLHCINVDAIESLADQLCLPLLLLAVGRSRHCSRWQESSWFLDSESWSADTGAVRWPLHRVCLPLSWACSCWNWHRGRRAGLVLSRAVRPYLPINRRNVSQVDRLYSSEELLVLEVRCTLRYV